MQMEILQKIDSDFWTLTPGEYKLVAIVEPLDKNYSTAMALENAFFLTQHLDIDWTTRCTTKRVWFPCRSTSVGDVIVVNGEFYVVDRFGFKPLAEAA